MIAYSAFSQITFSPAFPKANQEVTITYDATKGTSGLVGAAKVYMHAGVILDGANSTRWQKVVGNWGKDDNIGLMTSKGTNIWEIKITPNTYFNLAPTDTAYRIGMVFRNADGTKEGKDANGLDIFMPIYQDGLFIRIEKPSTFPIIFNNTTSSLSVEAVVSQNANISIKLDGVEVEAKVNKNSISHDITANETGKRKVLVEATAGGRTVSQEFSFVVRSGAPASAALPSNTVDGINYRSSTSVTLSLFAPQKEYVYVIGDFNNWEPDPAYEMKRTPDGNRYHLDINGLTAGKEYIFQYLVANPDGTFVRIGDPYADKVSDPWNDRWIPATTYPGLLPYPDGKTTGVATILQTDQKPYVWKTNNFRRPAKGDLIVYELLIRDFTSQRTFQSLIDTLGYLKKVGVNVIELMPIMEFEGNESWGYNPMYFFAVDKYYGHKNDLKRFIDTCHSQGIAVVLDMVLNHAFGLNPMVRLYWDAANNRPAANNPWFNPTDRHPFGVGFDFNHEAQATRAFTDRVLKYWLQEYRFDGFRFDLSKGFTQNNTFGDIGAWGRYDQSRINNWNRIYDEVRKYDSDAYMILEHFAENDEEKVLAEKGFMLWGNIHSESKQAIMGFNNSSMARVWNLNRGWNAPGVMAYMESHDEERMLVEARNFGFPALRSSVTMQLNRKKALAAIFYMIPGPKMLWQFGELGFDISINACRDGVRITPDCRTDNKPPKFDYLQSIERLRLYRSFSAIFKLKTLYGTAINFGNYKLDEFNTDANSKRVTIRHSDIDIVSIANLTQNSQTISPEFTRTGKWYDLLTNDSIIVTNLNQSISFTQGQFHIFTTKPIQQPYNDLAPHRWPAANRIPHAPTNLRAFTGSNGGLELRWTDNADNEAGFTLERSTSATSGFSVLNSPNANDTSFVDRTVQAGVVYYYRIKSRGGAAESGYSNVASAQLAVPAAPSDLKAVASENSVALNWRDNSEDETNFVVERSDSETSGFAVLAELPANTTSYTDPTAKPKTPQFYRVAAKNTIGNSLYSNTATATTTRLDQDLASQIALFPVPASAVLNLEVSNEFQGQIEFEVLDLTGKQIVEGSFVKALQSHTHSFEVSHLSKGMYVLKVKTQSGAYAVKRFAIE
jgi:1,4-alpha-glucan branching enzyme